MLTDVKEWLRYEKLGAFKNCKIVLTITGKRDKEEIGSKIIPRMIEQVFDEPELRTDLKRKVRVSLLSG